MPAHHIRTAAVRSEKAMASNERCAFTKTILEDWLETTPERVDEAKEQEEEEEQEEEDDDDEDEVDSCSTFSLQQCIDEFRARRIRRNSAHVSEQREEQNQTQETASAVKAGLIDADPINQNRSNKEHERKYKPCKNGFCYCFTSDSGDGGGGCFGAASVNTARGASQIRHARRSRKSESAQFASGGAQHPSLSDRVQERRSAPASLKSNVQNLQNADEVKHQKKSKVVQAATNTRRPLTAVSRLETTSHDAPLIHIIQELRDNCVVSEVRVNKHKLQQKRFDSEPGRKMSEKAKTASRGTSIQPTAPPIEEITSTNSSVENKQSKTIDMLSGNSIPISRLEIKSKSPRRKPGAGRLLQKRLSQTSVQYKPWDMTEPPPKPPRASAGSRLESSSSLTTTTSPSLREAARIVDDFLIEKGIQIPKSSHSSKKGGKILDTHDGILASSFLAPKDQQGHMPTCPSLSDIERIVDTKPRCNYGKNIQQSKDQSKDITFGWKESKVSEMLNYDSNGNRKEFKSQSAQAEPQSLGWQIPPKLELDMVDGAVCHNLAANLETKDTPVKRQFSSNRKEQQVPRTYPKFGWRNLSPWTTVSTHGTRMRKCSKGTSSFLRQSKKKILRLVTPKKDNKAAYQFQAHKNTPFRTVGIQTSLQELGSYANSSTPQSPPGSYHSAVQTNFTSNQSSTVSNNAPHSQSTNPSDSSQFDFTRKINSPKKPTRTSQRKLNFPSVCGVTSACFAENSGPEIDTAKNRSFSNFANSHRPTLATRTYRSYQTGIDQDVTISKMGAILSNIRARLEASDEHAVRTFEEIERREQLERGFDCPDSHGIRQRTTIDIHSNVPTCTARGYIVHEPIYSEIEEDSIHVTESPQFDNKTGIDESSCSASGRVDLETLYAKVNKATKQRAASIPLGKFLQDSLQRGQKTFIKHLPTLPEPLLNTSSNVSYSSPPLETSTQHFDYDYDSPTPSLMHCESLNNIRVMEHNTPPKHNRSISKSDLSLQRSEIFLENLCRSELIVGDGTLERLEKIDNLLSKSGADYISYDGPDDELENKVSGGEVKDTASNSSSISPQKFLTKPFQYKVPSSSCPVTPQKSCKSKQQVSQSNSQPNSLNNTIATETGVTFSAFARYKRLKHALQSSIRKGKNFVKARRGSLGLNSTPPLEEQAATELQEESIADDESCLNLDALFAIDESVPVTEQIARAVSICRQLPELDTTYEMVEAERLLLFTSLRYDAKKRLNYEMWNRSSSQEGLKRDFFIDTMRFPINFETNLAEFNYYFTVTFEIGSKIISTQSTECQYGEVVFRHCNIQFNAQKYQNEDEPSIQCNVFMLRLRKVTTKPLKDNDTTCALISKQTPDLLPLCSTPVSSESSLNGITSRFRRYASFIIDASIFKPFVADNDDTVKKEVVVLRSSNTAYASLKLYSKHESAESRISIDANVTGHFLKKIHSSFLHVQDPYSLHNWNRRWCNLNGLQLEVWTDISCMHEEPLLRLNLFQSKQSLPLMACTEGLCARKRSFCLQCLTSKTGLDPEMAAVFFAAENDLDLIQWLDYLNQGLDFIATWMQ